MLRLFHTLLLCLLVASPALGATYYVNTAGSDANSCATAQTNGSTAKLTISAGVACATAAGDTVLIADGTYSETRVQVTNSGSSGNPITIRCINRRACILATTETTSGAAAISTESVNYVTISGIKITNTSSFASTGMYLVKTWASHIPWIGGDQTTGNGHDIILDDIECANGDLAYGCVKFNTDNSTLKNSLLKGSAEAYNCNAPTFQDNDISTKINSGGSQGGGIAAKGGARNAVVQRNIIRITNTGDIGLLAGGNSGVTTGVYDRATDTPSSTANSGWMELYDSTFKNNLIFNETGANDNEAFGIRGCKNCTVVNNSVRGGGVSGYCGGDGSCTASTGPTNDNPIVKNNILEGLSYGACQPSWNVQNTATDYLDYNIFHSCTTLPSQSHGPSAPTTSVDPVFTSSTDLHTPTGPGVDAGLNSVCPSDDYAGTSRPQNSTCDIGGYEKVVAGGGGTMPLGKSKGLGLF